MAETPSSFYMSVGAQAPDFCLPDVLTKKPYTLSRNKGPRGTLIMFVCNHCPYVILLADVLGKWADEMVSKGIATVAICSNDSLAYPLDAPHKMKEFAEAHHWHFPYLWDGTQEVAQSFDAACTPDFFLLDENGCLFYAGQFDNARPGNGKAITGESLNAAVEALIEGKPAPQPFSPSTGCNIKWRPGNAPNINKK